MENALSVNWENHFKKAAHADDQPKVNQKIVDKLTLRLLAHGGPGWAYSEKNQPTAEPTALACLALANEKKPSEKVAAGLDFLARLQVDSGAVPACESLPHATWTTPLAVLAWSAYSSANGSRYEENVRRALDWMLRERGSIFNSDPRIYGHNTKLSAWPWIAGTHSWVEPTAYTMIALRAMGYTDHARYREALELLMDRAIPGSGWNYGNPKMFGASLRPFPATTGIALTALAGQAGTAAVDSAIHYLGEALQTIRAPSSLGWGTLGLSLWDTRPLQADEWLEESALRVLEREPRPAEESPLLLALRGKKTFQDMFAAVEGPVVHA